MIEPDEFRRLLDFIQEPVFIVRRSGHIEVANAGARALLGSSLKGRNLVEFTSTAADVVDTYLGRCSGSGSPLLASIMLRQADGKEGRFQIKGALLSKQQGHHADRIVLRCSATAFREFSRMSRQVDELNRENRKQRHARAVLQEALDQRDLLFREVQHRVRNQTQMLLGMVSAARRKAESDELSVFLDGLKQRLMAMSSVQQLMYTSASLDALSARDLIHDLCGSIAQTWPEGADLEYECTDAELSNDAAVPLALIIGELLSNALKHGLKFDSGTVSLHFGEDRDDLVLTVSDSGSGMVDGTDGAAASSGLALVRGMCRQIGGSFDINGQKGTCCTVRFPRPARQGRAREGQGRAKEGESLR